MHADVYQHMCNQGWDRKPGVRVVFGRWQDVIDQVGEVGLHVCRAVALPLWHFD